MFHPWALANVIECGGSEETAHTEGANELDVDQGDWASDDDDDAFDVAEDDSEVRMSLTKLSPSCSRVRLLCGMWQGSGEENFRVGSHLRPRSDYMYLNFKGLVLSYQVDILAVAPLCGM